MYARDILEFWFDSPDLHAPPPDGALARWFGADAAFDAEVVRRFGALLEEPERILAWTGAAAGALAAVIALDQLPRNAFRGTARAFATDPIALRVAGEAVAAGLDGELGVAQRVFLYLPFEHAEDLATQEEAVRLYTALLVATPDDPLARVCVPFATQHREIVRRFGRFPGRNAALGRADTPEEAAWLAGGGETFGQRR